MLQIIMEHYNIQGNEFIDMVNYIIEKKDAYTLSHVKRVAFYAVNIAEQLGVDEKTLHCVHHASLLHDIGKLITPESILLKPKQLTKDEFHIIKEHVNDGVAILATMSSFKELIPYIKHHHERYDGKGYPDQLKGEEIPFISRIITIADAFDAMTTERIYKPKRSIDEAILELERCSGSQFDPLILPSAIHFFRTHHSFNQQTTQMPKTILEEERFAFYFKDKITTAYSSEYLNYFLQQHVQKNYTHAYLFELKSLSLFNYLHGWNAGNTLLKEIVTRIKQLFQSSLIFRVFGDDFVLISQNSCHLDFNDVLNQLSHGLSPVTIHINSFSLEDVSLTTWEDFEPYLHKSNYTQGVIP